MKLSLSMRKVLGITLGAGAALVLIASAVFSGQSVQAAAPAGTPDVQIKISDSHTGSPNLPGSCAYDSAWVGTNEGTAGLPRSQDTADCMKVRILNGDPTHQYTRDFKLCLGIGGASGCTPWASDGGGYSGLISNGGDFRTAYIYVVDRDMPIGNMKVDSVLAGVQLYYQNNHDGCRDSSGMVYSSGPESNFAYGAQRDNDPGCAQIRLAVNQVLPPNAQYVSDTVPRQADPSTTYQAAITMRNTGLTWDSDQIITPEHNDCYNVVQNNGDTCDDSYTVQSHDFMLQRVDQTALTAPSLLPYRRVINVHYAMYSGEDCEWVDGGGEGVGGDPILTDAGHQGLIGRALATLMPVAHAEIIGPGGGGGQWVCTSYSYVNRSETPVRNVYYNGTTDFPVSVGTPAESGTYTLQYQMKQISTGQLFGDTASMPVFVPGGGNPDIGLACTTLSRTINAGDPADYAVSVSGINNFSGSVAIDVSPTSTLPGGVQSSGASVTLPPSPQNSLVVLTTSASTPAGTYPITMRATAQGVQPHDCVTELVVRGGTPTLTVTPSTQVVAVNDTAHYTATYDPDGSGPQASYEVTVPASWTSDIPNVATATGAGTFQATATGTTMIWASYAGLNASANLTVGAGQAALALVPSAATTRVGSQVGVRAMYYPNGLGTTPAVDVTNDSIWASRDETIAESLGSGTFRGIAEGNTGMFAVYQNPQATSTYLSADGTLHVDACQSPCSGAASLTIQPSSLSIPVGDNATFAAMYDQDGDGPMPARDVTGNANWSGPSIVNLISAGVFRGVTAGSGQVTAGYGGLTANADIAVTSAGSCNFTANPATLFIPPRRNTTLSWSCGQPTNCTVRTQDTPRAGMTIASGGQSGSGHDNPPYSTTYRLSCDNGVQQDLRVRVFDVSTRIEILPQ